MNVRYVQWGSVIMQLCKATDHNLLRMECVYFLSLHEGIGTNYLLQVAQADYSWM